MQCQCRYMNPASRLWPQGTGIHIQFLQIVIYFIVAKASEVGTKYFLLPRKGFAINKLIEKRTVH